MNASKVETFCLNENYYVKYQPEFKRFFGSSKAAIIFERLEYWSQKYSSGFWKFFEPCEFHPQYRLGDSWEEELGFSRKVFNRVFSLIGVHYKSKSDFRAQTDPFQGKLYASYYDRKTNRTYFLRNHDQVKTFLSSLWKNTKKITQKVKKISTHLGSSRNRPTGTSFARASEDISLDISEDIFLQTTTSSPAHPSTQSSSPPPEPDQIDDNLKLNNAQNMLDTWNKITENENILTPSLKTKLPQALEESFQGCLDTWKAYCLKIASSKFLMGEATNSHFKAWLGWIIKPDTIELIKGKAYSLGDRKVIGVDIAEAKTFNPDEIQGPPVWKEICQHLSDELGYSAFKSWFASSELIEVETKEPKLKCPTPFIKDRIQTYYQSTFEKILKKVLPQVERVEIC